MPIIGSLPITLANNTLADATQVMSDFNYIVTQVNGNAAALGGGNAFTGAQTISGDTITTNFAAQTLTNKTLTSPALNTPTLTTAVLVGDTTGLGVGIARSKATTTGRNTTTTFTDDPDLIVPLIAGRWEVELTLPIFATVSGAGGIKFQMAFSGTQTNNFFMGQGFINSAQSSQAAQLLATSLFASAAISTSSPNDWVRLSGVITVTVAGNLSLQWAQQSSNANNANVAAGSSMTCVKVG